MQASFPYDTVEPGYLDLQTGDELIVNRRDENGECNYCFEKIILSIHFAFATSYNLSRLMKHPYEIRELKMSEYKLATSPHTGLHILLSVGPRRKP